MRRSLGFLLVGSVAWGVWAGAGCGSSDGEQPPPGGDGGAPDGTGGGGLFGEGGTGQTLVVQPQNPTLEVTAPGATLAFQALLNGKPVVASSWTIDVAAIGHIDASGVFTASAASGGLVNVTATFGGQQAVTALTVHLQLTDNDGSVDGPTQGVLQAGGAADAAFKWLYPYDGTVFPRDLPSPSLQFALTPGATAPFDASYVHITAKGIDYKGYFKAGAGQPAQIRIKPASWAAITGSTIGGAPVTVAVTKVADGKVSGPITETWDFAPGNLRGSIFYNSYNSPIANNTGAILKLRPGGTPSVVIPTNPNGECHVCHVVSANGNLLIAANELMAPPTGAILSDGVYDLLNGATKVHDATPNRIWDFGALTPDGAKFLQYGAVERYVATDAGALEGWAPNVRGLGEHGDLASALFDPRTGAAIPAPGLDGQSLHMMMPAFSPDGKHVVFNHYDTGHGVSVAVMDFDDASNTFSKLRDVATLPAGQYAGWPSFTPDDRYVFFAAGNNDEYDTLSDNPAIPQATSDIVVAHVPSATTAAADALNGARNGASYLPFPDDAHLNYEPTILPVAAGGYYWVVFTSRRNYGNTVNGDPYAGAGGAPSPRKKLWVAAIDIDTAEHPASAARDLTYPAFYLEGQEVTAGNMRAFWALDPCEQNGTSCNTGDECCSGFCRQSSADGGVVFSCVPPNGCARESEKCTTAAECCDNALGAQCINGFCARPTPR